MGLGLSTIRDTRPDSLGKKTKKYDGAIVIVVFLWSGINHVVHEKSLMTHIDNGKLEL